ncbi:hypothetical protein HK102_008771, partial [Quaeritorhiza haematococci]
MRHRVLALIPFLVLANTAHALPQNGKNKNNEGGNGGNNGGGGDADAARGDAFCSANFPNMRLGDGSQNKQGSCSLTVQGQLPSFDKMVSSLITEPQDGETLPLNQPFSITVATRNMELGNFDDPQRQYYRTPQTLNQEGIIIGHQHAVMQRLPSANTQTPLDARDFAFFKGLDFEPDNKNRLTVEVPAGQLKQGGTYRICTITGTRGHQPVIMPVTDRGGADDCIR